MSVVLVIPRWVNTFTGHPAAASIRDVLSAHLGVGVTTAETGRGLTITVYGSTPDDVQDAAELYLGGAHIPFDIEDAA